MEFIIERLSCGVEQLIERTSGPMNFRLFIMPIIVTIIAVRAGLKDVRHGQPAFLWAILTKPRDQRRALLRTALKDIGRIFIAAVVLDTIYQVIVLRAVYIGQVLIVAVACAIVPYVLIRGPIARLTRAFKRSQMSHST